MKIELTAKAKKQLIKLPKTEAKKVIKKIKLLETFPLAGKKLKGELSDRYSYRAWPYRIIYVISNKKTIQIDTIEHRQGSYK